MISACMETFGLALSVLGTLLVMVSCGLPMWKVTAFIEGNIVVVQNFWNGLWMSCVVQSTGQMQCKVYDSVLALSTDIQTARALTVISAVMGVVGLMITVAGAQCTNCIKTESLKARAVNVGGVTFILSGLLVLVPLCWIANNIIVTFYDRTVPAGQKREIGASIYIGWAATALLFCGGTILCCSCPSNGNTAYTLKYPPPPKSLGQNGDYDKKNYV